MVPGRTVRRSNRTFMELKYGSADLFVASLVGSNRTFMELKYRDGHDRLCVDQF